MKKCLGLLALVMALAVCFASYQAAAEVTKDAMIESAKKALTDQGIALVEGNLVYDENNDMWEEWGTIVEQTPNDANHGVLPHGVLENKNYQTIYFDFVDDAKKDIWVFVDKDTGDVLKVYVKK